ncbi:MAG: hypothetical protein LH629_12870 [Ignavibacteria bacterium]|nr:hypothetical protein [Ignavibacteria bacterium]
MNSINFSKGAILLGANNHPKDGNHYIIYFDELNGFDFIGGMISTKNYGGKNKPMEYRHFEIKNETNNNKWKISFNKSQLIPAKLHKFNEMGEFEQVGQLTPEGIDFVKSVINDMRLMTWDEYRNS